MPTSTLAGIIVNEPCREGDSKISAAKLEIRLETWMRYFYDEHNGEAAKFDARKYIQNGLLRHLGYRVTTRCASDGTIIIKLRAGGSGLHKGPGMHGGYITHCFSGDEEYYNHFVGDGQDASDWPGLGRHWHNWQEDRQKAIDMVSPRSAADIYVDEPISQEEINRAMKYLRVSKAAGPSGM